MIRFVKTRLAVASALMLGGLPAGLFAQANNAPGSDNTGYGTTSAEFLLLGAGARGTALGNAFAAMSADATALYYNPAGIALMPRASATLSTYTYVADTRYSWGGIAFPFAGGSKSFGLQLGTFGFNDQPVYTVEQPDGTGAKYSVNETFAGLTFAQNFSDRFAAGITLKAVIDNLGDVTGTAFAVDFGTNFHSSLNGHPVKFSFVLANLGTNISYSGDVLNVGVPRTPLPGEQPVPTDSAPAELRTKDFPLPTNFRVAIAYDLIAAASSRLTVLGDFNQPSSNGAGFVLGSEYAIHKIGSSNFGVSLRGSYSYQPANSIEPADVSLTQLSDKENLQGLAFGGGLNYSTSTFLIGFDYAYKYMGVLGPTHFFSVDFGW